MQLSYYVVDSLIWLGIRDLINEFRKKKLKLRPVTYLSGSYNSPPDVPYGYIWSPHLVPKPKGHFPVNHFALILLELITWCAHMADLCFSLCLENLSSYLITFDLEILMYADGIILISTSYEFLFPFPYCYCILFHFHGSFSYT